MHTHFQVDARELLLDQPERCPFYMPLALQGIAVTPTGQHHLVLNTPAARFYAGPDTATVARRAQLLVAAAVPAFPSTWPRRLPRGSSCAGRASSTSWSTRSHNGIWGCCERRSRRGPSQAAGPRHLL